VKFIYGDNVKWSILVISNLPLTRLLHTRWGNCLCLDKEAFLLVWIQGIQLHQPAKKVALVLLSVSGLGPGTLSQWTEWAPWSECSHTCGTGIQTRLVTACSSQSHKCKVGKQEWQACNVESCGSTISWRDHQCLLRLNDSVLYSKKASTSGEWIGVINTKSPCNIVCKSRASDEIVKFSEYVPDGTICGDRGELRLCLTGTCEKVGCDLKLRSSSMLDRCGVCGGDGTTCPTRHVHTWTMHKLSICSATCGGGTLVMGAQCIRSSPGSKSSSKPSETVHNEFCDPSLRPESYLETCNKDACPPSWELGEWSKCDENCSGNRTRSVKCKLPVKGKHILVDEEECSARGVKPVSSIECSEEDCDTWEVGPWSPCTRSCGIGVQSRYVICSTSSGQPGARCFGERPISTQYCRGGCVTIDDVKSGKKSSGWVRVNEDGREMEDIDSINKSQQDQVLRKNNFTGRVEFLETSSCSQHLADMLGISFIILINALWCCSCKCFS